MSAVGIGTDGSKICLSFPSSLLRVSSVSFYLTWPAIQRVAPLPLVPVDAPCLPMSGRRRYGAAASAQRRRVRTSGPQRDRVMPSRDWCKRLEERTRFWWCVWELLVSGIGVEVTPSDVFCR